MMTQLQTSKAIIIHSGRDNKEDGQSVACECIRMLLHSGGHTVVDAMATGISYVSLSVKLLSLACILCVVHVAQK